MSWISTRESVLAVCWVSIFFLLGGGSLIGLGLTESIKNSGITIAHWIAGGLAFIIFAFWQRYI